MARILSAMAQDQQLPFASERGKRKPAADEPDAADMSESSEESTSSRHDSLLGERCHVTCIWTQTKNLVVGASGSCTFEK